MNLQQETNITYVSGTLSALFSASWFWEEFSFNCNSDSMLLSMIGKKVSSTQNLGMHLLKRDLTNQDDR